MRKTERRGLGYAPLFLRGQEIPYVLDTWGSVIIELTIAFQPTPVASLRSLLKVQVMRLSTSRKNIIKTDMWFLANITDFKTFFGLMGKDEGSVWADFHFRISRHKAGYTESDNHLLGNPERVSIGEQ